jgi:hypothetical protein
LFFKFLCWSHIIEIQFQGGVLLPPPPIEVNKNLEYEVNEVLDSQIKRCHLEYFVHWKGYDISEHTWEHASSLKDAPYKIVSFHVKYPQRPKIAPHGTSR